jgi:hypothetical protein
MIWVKYLNYTLPDKEHLLNITLVTDDSFTWCIEPAIHINDEFISKASFTFIKEVIECLFKVFEDPGTLDQIGLHFRCHLLIELEFFDDQIEIEVESLFYILTDIIVQSGLDMKRFV